MSQILDELLSTTGLCTVEGCTNPSFAKLNGGTARCITHLQEQMDWVENVSREEKGKSDG